MVAEFCSRKKNACAGFGTYVTVITRPLPGRNMLLSTIRTENFRRSVQNSLLIDSEVISPSTPLLVLSMPDKSKQSPDRGS